jgi:hypothetical protein
MSTTIVKIPFKNFFSKDNYSHNINDLVLVDSVSNKYNKKNLSKLIEDEIKIPEISKEAYYGWLIDIENNICSKSEALTISAILEVMGLLSASIDPENLYLPYGATKTVIRLNSMCAGGTSSGKGVGSSQIRPVLNKIQDENSGLMSPIFRGGISTPEGIIAMIRDKDDSKINKSSDMRVSTGNKLFVMDEEISRILTLSNNSASVLSNCLRNLFDGTPVEPLTKYNPVGCKKPHVALYGHITPQELLTVLKPVDIFNGFLNRFPIYFGSRTKSIPYPEVVSSQTIGDLSEKLSDTITWANDSVHQMKLSDCYKTMWEDKYDYLRTLGHGDDIEEALLCRSAHYAVMYAMLFAVIDKQEVITSAHLKASLAWIDHWHLSIRYIFKTAGKKMEQNKLKERAGKVFDVIIREIAANEDKPIGKTPITKAFSGKYTAKEINEILDDLQRTDPPKIKVTRHKRNTMEIELC